MPFPVPAIWTLDSADWTRDEQKREHSPASFFWSQGQALILAAGYFKNERLVTSARGGVARKHRHRIHLALFGQLMASFEYLLKDFVATVVDLLDVYDARLRKADWLELEIDRLLAQRSVQSSLGAVLIHPTLGWHKPEVVNLRYKQLFAFEPIAAAEVTRLNALWLVRHSVAHNAGFVTSHDAFRLGSGGLAERVVALDVQYLTAAFDFLAPIARRLSEDLGAKILKEWLAARADEGASWDRDRGTYVRLKWIGCYLNSRTRDLLEPTEAEYVADWRKHVGAH